MSQFAANMVNMFTDRFPRKKRGAALTAQERARLETVIGEVKSVSPRTTSLAGETLIYSTFMIKGFMSRYIDDRNGHRQLVRIMC